MNRQVNDSNELHFLSDNEEEIARELHDYIYEKLHRGSTTLYFRPNVHEQFISNYGNPIGEQLSILYFAIVGSWSEHYDNDDTGIPLKAWQDVGIFGNPRDSQHWRDDLIEIDDTLLRDTIQDLPLLPELCRDVYSFFLFQFSRHTFDSYQPGIKTKHEKKRINAWISYVEKLLQATERFVKASSVKTQTIEFQTSTLLPNGTTTTDVARCLDKLFDTDDEIHDHYLIQASLEKAAARIFNLGEDQIHSRWQDAKKEGITESKRKKIVNLLPIVEAALRKDIRVANGFGTD